MAGKRHKTGSVAAALGGSKHSGRNYAFFKTVLFQLTTPLSKTYNIIMRRKNTVSQTLENDDRVRLKPFGGIRPGVYIASGLLLILLTVLYFILLHPGITRPGSVVVFTSDPIGAALRVNDVYLGNSPLRVFVPKGNHVMEAVLPGFEPQRSEHEVRGRLFASALFPRRLLLNVTLEAADPAATLALSAADFAAWSFGGEPTPAWQIPLALSEGVYRVGQTVSAEEVDGILAASARFAVTRAALRDLVRARTLASGGGVPPSPITLSRSVSDIISFLSQNHSSPLWLADTLPSDLAGAIISSVWYQNRLAGFAEITAGETLSPLPREAVNRPDGPPFEQIRVGGLMFTGLSGGTLVQGEPFPHHVSIEPFMICATPIPVPAWMDFLDANPAWRPEQREILQAQGLVDSEYLADFGHIMPGRGLAGLGTINSVSWFAAVAFCEWLTRLLPESLADWEVRLPTESEWEFAAKSARSWGNHGYFLFYEGNFWEWCMDPYSPLPIFSASREAVDAVGSPERPVRGGSWLNAAGTVSPETRGSLPPALSSSFVSFRPIIARRAGTP